MRKAAANLAPWGILACLLTCLLTAAIGCGRSDQRLLQAIGKTGRERRPVCPLAGKVTIDGQIPPSAAPNQKLIVMLFDRAQPKLNVNQRPYVECNSQGEFSFTTYKTGDGIDPGDYVIVFAQLTLNRSDDSYQGPDGLKNLYNDPDKNGTNPEFSIKHEAPENRMTCSTSPWRVRRPSSSRARAP